MPGNLKLVLEMSDSDQKISVQGVEDGCDPKFKVYRGVALSTVLELVGDLVGDWKTEWVEEPRNPAYKKPRTPRATKAKTEPEATPAAPEVDPEPSATTTAELPLLADTPGGQVVQGEKLLALPAEEPTATETPAEPESVAEGESERRWAWPTSPAEPEPVPAEVQDEVAAEGPPDLGLVPTGEPGPEPGQLPHQKLEREPDLPEETVFKDPAHDEAPDPQPAVPVMAGTFTVDGEGSFPTVHAALLSIGVTQADIDVHKYWHRVDRLPKAHAERIAKVV